MRNHASTITRLPFTGPGHGYPPPGSRHHKKHQTADALNKNCLNVGGHPGTYLSYLSYFAYFYTAFHLPSHLRNPGAGRTASLGGRASLDLCGDVIDAVFWFLILRRLALIAA
jgi:hypothetical protein